MYFAHDNSKKVIKDDDDYYGYGHGGYGYGGYSYGYDRWPDKYVKKDNDLTYYASSKNDHNLYENSDY